MWRPGSHRHAIPPAHAAGRHITATATQIILCGRPHKRDYILLYRGDREALSGSLDRIQRAASVILKAVTVGG